MNTLRALIWIEGKKALRSRVPLFTLLGFLFMPLGISFLMIIYKDPEAARASGLLAAKANLVAASADWPTFLSMLTQGVALAGFILFTMVVSWVFGREFADGTVKDLLALPVSRATVLLAKFSVAAVWCLGLVLAVFVVSLVTGALIGLEGGSAQTLVNGGLMLAGTALLALAVAVPAALFASIGRGYLLPIGVAALLLIVANVLAVAGWGSYVPWAIPSIYAGSGGPLSRLEPASIPIVLLTGVFGIVATVVWWQTADQNR